MRRYYTNEQRSDREFLTSLSDNFWHILAVIFALVTAFMLPDCLAKRTRADDAFNTAPHAD